MSDELLPAPRTLPSADEMATLYRLGKGLADSGFFKDARQGTQAFAKLMFGRDLGLSATAAMTGIYIVEGKPEISANVQAQMVRTFIGPEGERYDYKVLEHDAEHCVIQFRRRERGGEWELLGTETYTMDDAKRANLAGKGVWKSHPRNMLFARCMSNGVAFNCPEVTGGIRTYHEQEISSAPVNETESSPEDDTIAFGDDALGQRLQAAYDTIAELKPEAYRPAKVRMILAHATDEEREAFAQTLEREIAESNGEAQVSDAVVVDEVAEAGRAVHDLTELEASISEARAAADAATTDEERDEWNAIADRLEEQLASA